MASHDDARMQAAPDVAELMRIVAADRGCSTDDLSQTLHDAFERFVLEHSDPWGFDRRTPVAMPDYPSEELERTQPGFRLRRPKGTF